MALCTFRVVGSRCLSGGVLFRIRAVAVRASRCRCAGHRRTFAFISGGTVFAGRVAWFRSVCLAHACLAAEPVKPSASASGAAPLGSLAGSFFWDCRLLVVWPLVWNAQDCAVQRCCVDVSYGSPTLARF